MSAVSFSPCLLALLSIPDISKYRNNGYNTQTYSSDNVDPKRIIRLAGYLIYNIFNKRKWKVILFLFSFNLSLPVSKETVAQSKPDT
jgi:hypothetical protein